jgi:hypothetical protein
MAETEDDKELERIRFIAIGDDASFPYAAKMLSQSLFAPVFRRILSQKNNVETLKDAAKNVYSDDETVASTSEILLGYYHEPRDDFFDSFKKLKETEYSDPLAFTIGFSTPQPGEPLNLKSLHKRYNEVALELIRRGDVSVFGHILDSPFKGGVGRYTGGLEEPLVTVAQLTNWWFLRPKHEDAIGTFQTVKEYIETINPQKAKENDKLILDQAAKDMIGAKASAGMWGGNAEEIFDVWKEFKPLEARAALRSRTAVDKAMELDTDDIEYVGKILEREREEDEVKDAINNFYNESVKATTVEEAIKSAFYLLIQLVYLDEECETTKTTLDDLLVEVAKGEKLQEKLTAKLTELTEQVVELESNKSTPVKQKLETPRLGRDAAALIFQHTHPEILTQVFSKETVDHFDSIASNLFTEQEQEEEDETPLVVSSSSSITTGEINRWLL